MLRIGIVEDEIGDMVNVIRNLMALDRSRYEFEVFPVLLSDPEVDTPEAVEDWAELYGKEKLREHGVAVDRWPRIEQKGKLCPADEEDRLEILQYLADQKVNLIISDCWIGRDAGLQSKYPDAALQVAGVMLLDSAVKEERWRDNKWECWMMTKYQPDVLEKLYEVGGWRAEKFDPYNRFMDKARINNSLPGYCDSQLERAVQEAIAEERISQGADLPADVAREGRFSGIVGKSEPMQKVFRDILAVADTGATVIILGETGTGKNLVAKAIHLNSHRKNEPFVSVNMAAIPETLFESELFGYAPNSALANAEPKGKPGKFELAHKGTIFLNEIGDMPLSIQAKVLDVFDAKEVTRLGASWPVKVDVRIVTGTHQPLERMKEEGTFRKDLYYRVSVIDIRLPPLRERPEDIELLCRHFIAQYSKANGINTKDISPEALTILRAHHWPGNVRDLENFISRAIFRAGRNEIIDVDNEALGTIENIDPTNDGVAEIWSLIKQGRVVRTLPEWMKEIGKPKTLGLIELVLKEYNRHPNDEETQAFFKMNNNAWRAWIHRNK